MTSRTPWHHRSSVVAAARSGLRRSLFTFLRRALATDDGKQILAASLQGVLPASAPPWHGDTTRPQPYPDLPAASREHSRTDLAGAPVFITARFRTGSTLLWNVFRQIDDVTAYYEPFNERRWFDSPRRGAHTDATHRNVSDYWSEYRGLDILGRLYDEKWVTTHLYMEATSWNPSMRRFIEILVERARGRPVLQFNHVDFRLPWLRHNFPQALIVHLYRHPRDQWCSSLFGSTFPLDGDMASFERCDHFYLLSWARDLAYRFPFLREREVTHPYQLFYYVWRLSYLFGIRYSHYSLAFEALAIDPEGELRRLLRAVGATAVDVPALAALVVPPEISRWKGYADGEWFRRHEAQCEEVLDRFLGSSHHPAANGARPDGGDPIGLLSARGSA